MRANRHVGYCRLVVLTRGRRTLCVCTRPRWRRRKPEHHRPDAWAKAPRPDGTRRDSTRGGAHRGWVCGPHHISPAPRRRCSRTHRCVLRQQDARDVRCSRRRRRRRGREHAEEQGRTRAHAFCLRRLDWSSRRPTARRNACRSRCRRRGRASPFIWPSHRAGRVLASCQPAGGLVRRRPDRRSRALMGIVRAATRGLRRAGDRSVGRSELRCSGGRVSRNSLCIDRWR